MFSREYFQGGESSYPIAALLHTREPGEGVGLPAGRVGSNRTLTFPVGPGEGGGLLLQCGHRPHPPNLYLISGDSPVLSVPGPDPWQEFPFSPIS